MRVQDLVEPIWERQPGESEAAFTRFLFYRNLVFHRTIELAYQSWLATAPAPEGENGKNRKKSDVTSGQWRDDSTEFHWRKRASFYDISLLKSSGKKVAQQYMAFVEKFGQVLMADLDAPQIKVKNLSDLFAKTDMYVRLVKPDKLYEYFSDDNPNEAEADSDEDQEPEEQELPDIEELERANQQQQQQPTTQAE